MGYKMLTSFGQAWADYKKTPRYKATIEIMDSKGIVWPYNENILHEAFTIGWNATLNQIKILSDGKRINDILEINIKNHENH